MPRYDKFDVLMKMLEIIEYGTAPNVDTDVDDERSRILTVIQRMYGTVVQQNQNKENNMTGDRFENVSQSVISTHGSNAQGAISVAGNKGKEVALALHELQLAIQTADGIKAEKQTELLELLCALADHAGQEQPSKPVLATLGNAIWKGLQSVDSISKIGSSLWPIIKKLWA